MIKISFRKYFGKKTKFLVITIITANLLWLLPVLFDTVTITPERENHPGMDFSDIFPNASLTLFEVMGSRSVIWIWNIMMLIFIMELLIWSGLGINYVIKEIRSRKLSSN